MLNIKDNIKVDYSRLIKNYRDALKDDQFKNFVSKIKLDEDKLMCYTSTLQESCEELNNCLNCKNLSECKNKMIGYTYLPKIIDGKLVFNYKGCRYKKNIEKKQKHLKNVTYYNLPQALKDADWSNIDKRLVKRKDTFAWLNHFLTNYPAVKKGLFLTGPFGCGKTFMIVAMFNELAKKNIKSAILFWPEFLRELKTSFDTDYAERIEYIKKTPLLLIDDIGAESVTSWNRDEILCPILQYRMDEKLPTFLTSNCSIDALTEHLSNTRDGVEIVKANRIIERIKQLTEEITMISNNLRK